MKTKLYIVTYKHPELLNATLENLFRTDYSGEIFIVNNHSEFKGSFDDGSKYEDEGVKVLHNVFRPDSSTGHLSRNYNEIILHGIKDIRRPDCDVLIHCHNDTTFALDWFSKLLEHHKIYNFITQSQGCGFCSYLPEAINEIGVWDERFNTIGYHEGDYFLRAIKYNGLKTSINDLNQGRGYNVIPEKFVWKNGNFTNSDHATSFGNYSVCRQMFEMKWGIRDVGWYPGMVIPDPRLPTYILYPYFEKYLKNLDQKYFQGIDCFGKPFMDEK
jgi:hypothetical protein